MAVNPYPNVLPLARTGGEYYAFQAVLPPVEGDLANNAGLSDYDPASVDAALSVLATVQFFCIGEIVSNTSYVVMQTDNNDNNWIDLAWCTFTGVTGVTGIGTYAMSGGYAGANAFLLRSLGNAPSPANGSNQIPLGGRLRFVGKSLLNTTTSSSSNAPGVVSEVLVNIAYKLINPR